MVQEGRSVYAPTEEGNRSMGQVCPGEERLLPAV